MPKELNEKKKKIQARTKVPQKQRKMLIFRIFALIVLVVASDLISQLAIGYLLLWILGADTFSQPVWTAIYSALSYVSALLILLLVSRIDLKKKGEKSFLKTDREEIGLKGLPTWTDIGLAPVGFVVYLIMAGLFLTLFSIFPWFDANQTQDVGFSLMSAGADRILAFLTLVVVAPIMEEVIFRGWFYGKLRDNLAQEVSEKTSIVVSTLIVSLIFGILHFQWNVGVNVFALSIVLCLLREITGTTYAGILLHMIKNGVAFYLLFIAVL
ncbi:CPBP family intramembrane metalloprotease [Candidatus Saccharibacteria bacterium]|nr:CPBP family intramembrane metalloprotease [Candidatus Saccharibacteria bacterium]